MCTRMSLGMSVAETNADVRYIAKLHVALSEFSTLEHNATRKLAQYL